MFTEILSSRKVVQSLSKSFKASLPFLLLNLYLFFLLPILFCFFFHSLFFGKHFLKARNASCYITERKESFRNLSARHENH